MKKIIAIDPDLHKNGVAVYENKKYTVITSMYLWDVFDLLTQSNNNELLVLLEYPKNTNTYHLGGKGAALNVGKNQAIAIILKEFMIKNNITHKILYPSGYSIFFKDEKFFKNQTGWDKRTNKDSRSAAAMIFKIK